MTIFNMIKIAAIIFVYIRIGRQLSSYPTLHFAVHLPYFLEKLFFLKKNTNGQFNICGIIWMVIAYITGTLFAICLISVGIFFTKEQYFLAIKVIIIIELGFIAFPMMIYAGICELLIRYDRY